MTTPPTLEEHVESYLEAHAVGRDPKTIDVLRFRLGYATKTFGELPLDELERRAPEIAGWMTTLPQGSRHGIVQALRQCFRGSVPLAAHALQPGQGSGWQPAAQAR